MFHGYVVFSQVEDKINERMAMTREKILVDPEIGEVVFRKSTRSRRVAIRVHPVRGVTVSVPYIVPYAAAMAFFKLKRGWVIEAQQRQKSRLKDNPVADAAEIEALRRQAKTELPVRLAELAARHGFAYNKVTIKHNATNWGSCSTKNNINLTLNIVRLPKVLQDYILLHELCHLRHHDHGHAFHLLLEHVLTDNLMKYLDSDFRNSESSSESSPEVRDLPLTIARKAAVSKAKYPVDYTFTREIRRYRLL